MGPITADRRSGALLLPFWKIPHTVTDDTGYFKTHHAQGGGFWLLRSDDEAQSWEEPREMFPERNAEGWACWNNNSGHAFNSSKEMLRAGWSCLRSCSNPASPATWRASAGGLCFPTSKLRFCTPSQAHA